MYFANDRRHASEETGTTGVTFIEKIRGEMRKKNTRVAKILQFIMEIIMRYSITCLHCLHQLQVKSFCEYPGIGDLRFFILI